MFNEDQQNTYWAGSDDVLYQLTPQQQTTQIGTVKPSTDARFAMMLHLNNGTVYGVDGTRLLIWSADQNGQLFTVGSVVKGQ